MKRFLSVLLFLIGSVIYAQPNLKHQEVYFQNEILGLITYDTMPNIQHYEGSHKSLYTFSLVAYRDLGDIDRKFISQLVMRDNSYSRLLITYDYSRQSSRQQAGHLIYEAGNLYQQSRRIRYGALALGFIGSTISLFVLGTESSRYVLIGTGIVTTIMGVASESVGYRADTMVSEAGVLLQRE